MLREVIKESPVISIGIGRTSIATIVGENFVNRKADFLIPPRIIIARVHCIVIRVVGHQRRVKGDQRCPKGVADREMAL